VTVTVATLDDYPSFDRNGGCAKFTVYVLFAAALTEPLSCLAHGWDIVSPIHVGEKILITGAGIIGNLWVCTLHLQGHRNVTVSEPNTARLDMLKKLGQYYQQSCNQTTDSCRHWLYSSDTRPIEEEPSGGSGLLV
jgi:hypothetical protein